MLPGPDDSNRGNPDESSNRADDTGEGLARQGSVGATGNMGKLPIAGQNAIGFHTPAQAILSKMKKMAVEIFQNLNLMAFALLPRQLRYNCATTQAR